MIQIYVPGNTNFDKNGDAVLSPSLATVSAEINGTWSASIIHPLAGNYELLQEGAVVKMPSYNGEQLFRIVTILKTLDGVDCEMQPIFFDAANDCFLTDVRPTKKNGQQALDIMCAANVKYSGESDITKISTAYYEYMNLLEALSGEDNAFIFRWGGELEYDNFKVRAMSRLGSDTGRELRYGKNIIGLSDYVDMTEVVTRIYPKAFNGRKLTGTPYVDSPHINSFPTIRAATIVFDNIRLISDIMEEDRSDPDIIICKNQRELNAALQEACQGQFDAGLDKPSVTIEIDDLVDLSKVEGYEGLDEALHLGDTVHLRHSLLDIVTDARVISLTYDSLEERVTAVTIGKMAYNYMNSLSSAVNRVQTAITPSGAVRAETVAGIMDMKKASLYAQYDAAERQDVLGILFENNDANSELYGAMALGTAGFMIADTKNVDGTWNWRTFGTAKGFLADCIVAGILASRNGKSYWDLDKSEIRFYDDWFDSYVRLDEGFIEFGHAGEIFGKILRMTNPSDGSDVFTIQSGDKYITISNDYIRMRTPNGSVGISENTGQTYLRMGDMTFMLSNGSESAQLLIGENTKIRAYDSTDYQYIDMNSHGTYIRVDGKSGYIRTECSDYQMNGYHGYTGSVTISGHTFTIKNGVITGVT